MMIMLNQLCMVYGRKLVLTETLSVFHQVSVSLIVGGNPNAQIPTVSCYNDYSFQQHEWQSHGVCASHSASTFFTTVCNLSAAPLKLMAQLKAKGQNLATIANGLASAGYPVFNRNAGNDQLELSVCAGSDGVWRLASTSNFDSACGF
ncbi:hypothetical protein HDV01_003542 [Terramyces sp. JEL0728]|nr:hypothetical protein HDV01_003542 [Terramyces sp. JEL0728]